MTAAVAETTSVENLIKAQAYGLGFDLVGITTLGPMETAENFDAWIDKGYAGEMEYLRRGAEKRRDSRLPFDGAISAIVAGLNYGGRETTGPVARYARGDDYHDVMTDRLVELHRWLEAEIGQPIRGKPYVDTGPVLERDLARRAGLGWFGKNTNLVNPDLGSFFFIGALVVDINLVADAPFEADRCGRCTRCLDACPTGAFVDERVLDATKCISYLTIEAKGEVPVSLREKLGGLIYGCDICQDVCPWNTRFSQDLREDSFKARESLGSRDARTLAIDILRLDDESFRLAFRGSPMKRAKLRGLKRNAAVALGNTGTGADIATLAAVADDKDPMVAEHARWAMARITERERAN
jgi:epoxyqueuosine reductase